MAVFNYAIDYSRIKDIRIKNNLTQQQMANFLNIQKPTYTQFENMKRELFPITKFSEIANYFNVSMDYLLKLSDNSKIDLDNKTINVNEVGKRLKEIRKENKLYQDTLAKSIGSSVALISEYENGKRLISLTFGYAICKKYNISMDYLYGKTNKNKYLNK